MIKLSFKNPYLALVLAVVVVVLAGALIPRMPVDILPQFKKSAMQILTLYPGMPAEVVEKDITSRMERWTGQSPGIEKQLSKSIMGVSIVTNFYGEDIDPAEAMANTSSYAMSDMYYQPPGTLPPMVQPFDPTASKPLMLLTVSSKIKSGKVVEHSGHKIDLLEKLKQGKVVVTFYRGSWCRYCNKHMSDFQDSLPFIFAKGASIIAVTPETNESIERTISKTGATFSIIYDSSYVIMKKYGAAFNLKKSTVRKYKLVGIDLEESNGNKDNILPVPATFIINQDGIIEFVHFDENYKKRLSVREIISKL